MLSYVGLNDRAPLEAPQCFSLSKTRSEAMDVAVSNRMAIFYTFS